MPVLMSTPSPAQHRSSVMCSRAERLRLRPWLERMIEEQAIPGLDWADEKAKIVRIPWKHAARHGWSRDKDASLFKEWAIHTKKYDPNSDQPKANPKIWKANFRCAINSLPDIEELKDQGKTKGNDAFKVYRLNPKKPKKSKAVSDSSTVKKSRNPNKSAKPRRKHVSNTITSISTTSSPSQLSIQCSSVSLNVINPPPPPPYESVLRERLEQKQRFQLTSTPMSATHRGHSNNRIGLQLNPGPSFSTLPPPFSSYLNTSRTSPIPPTPSTCSSTLSSPVSTVSSPVFTYPNVSFPHPLNIKQEKQDQPDYDDMVSQGSGDNMSDEELVEMVVQMGEDSPVHSPSAAVPTMSLDNSCNHYSGSNEWMTSTVDDKQYYTNAGTTSPDRESTSTYQPVPAPPVSYASTSQTFFSFPDPTAPSASDLRIKREHTTECRAPCAMQDVSHPSCYEGNLNNYTN